MVLRPANILKSLFVFALLLCLHSYRSFAQPLDPNNVYEQTTQIEADVPVDIDGDGMHNWWELLYGLDPVDPSDASLELDGDGLINLVEFQHLTSPLNRDTDGGGVWDDLEIQLGKNPLDPADDFRPITFGAQPEEPQDPRGDSDGDGISNTLEDEFGTNKHSVDTDEDGVNDYDEIYTYLTNPLEPDTDQDGLSDSDEIYNYFTSPTNRDSDFDGLTDTEEIFTHGTDPNNWDSDDGGMSDLDELNSHSDPTREGDDYQFSWDVYFGTQPNELYQSLDKNKIDIYQGMDLNMEAVKPAGVRRVSINYNGKSFETEKDYIRIKLLSPEEPGIYSIEFILVLTDGREVRMSRFVEVRQRGKVISRIDGTFNDLYDNFKRFDTKPVEGAKVEVYVYNQVFGELQLYQPDVFEMANPEYTDSQGSYLLALKPGDYLIKISKTELGTKDVLYSTDEPTIYSQDLYINYDYDNFVWGGIFIGTFSSVWIIINFLNLLKFYIYKHVFSKIGTLKSHH